MSSDEFPVVDSALNELSEARELLQALAAFTSISFGLVSVLCRAVLDVDPTAKSVKQLDRASKELLSLWTTQPAGCVLGYIYSDFDRYEILMRGKEFTVTDDSDLEALRKKLWLYICQHPVKCGGSFAFDILSYVDLHVLTTVGDLVTDIAPAPMRLQSSIDLIKTAGAVADVFARTVRTTYRFSADLGHTFTAVDKGMFPVKKWCCEYDTLVKRFHTVAGLHYTEVAQSLGMDRIAIMVEATVDKALTIGAQPPTETKERKAKASRKVRSTAAAPSATQDEAEPRPSRRSTRAGSAHTAT